MQRTKLSTAGTNDCLQRLLIGLFVKPLNLKTPGTLPTQLNWQVCLLAKLVLVIQKMESHKSQPINAETPGILSRKGPGLNYSGKNNRCDLVRHPLTTFILQLHHNELYGVTTYKEYKVQPFWCQQPADSRWCIDNAVGALYSSIALPATNALILGLG